ncbi:MAG: hypothetical protein E7233_04090 [Lachnospiraceae bacterium]|nr:hypothetical protein [Lachnospiraceae bacterium]
MFKKSWLEDVYGTPQFPVLKEEISSLTNQHYLKKIALASKCYEFRQTAVCRLDDQKLLFRIAQKNESIDARIDALKRITDTGKRLSAALPVINDGSISDHYRIEAIGSVIHDFPRAQEELRTIISRADLCDAVGAAQLLEDKELAQEVFQRAALNCRYGTDRMKAIRNINDGNVLLRIIKAEDDGEVAMTAASRITDPDLKQSAFREIASAERFSRLYLKYRYDAAVQLNDRELKISVLKDILETAECGVNQKSGTYTWQDKNKLQIVNDCKSVLNSLGE